MSFAIYTQEEIASSQELTDFLLDTIIDNLSYLFGEDMGSRENREEWIHYNLKTPHPHWRVILGEKCGQKAGFLFYTIENHCLSIHDIEISADYRYDPSLLRGLLRTLFQTEGHRFCQISGYINKGNLVSQRNFLKYTSSVTEKPNGYMLFVDEEMTSKIKAKFQKNT